MICSLPEKVIFHFTTVYFNSIFLSSYLAEFSPLGSQYLYSSNDFLFGITIVLHAFIHLMLRYWSTRSGVPLMGCLLGLLELFKYLTIFSAILFSWRLPLNGDRNVYWVWVTFLIKIGRCWCLGEDLIVQVEVSLLSRYITVCRRGEFVA